MMSALLKETYVLRSSKVLTMQKSTVLCQQLNFLVLVEFFNLSTKCLCYSAGRILKLECETLETVWPIMRGSLYKPAAFKHVLCTLIKHSWPSFDAPLFSYQVYEPVEEGSYIKMIDMVSGNGGQIQVCFIYVPDEELCHWCHFILISIGYSIVLTIPECFLFILQVNNISGYLPGRIVFFLVWIGLVCRLFSIVKRLYLISSMQNQLTSYTLAGVINPIG